jgi:hypothetical protein
MKETPRRRITDQLGNRMVVRVEGFTPPDPSPFLSRFLDIYLKTT